MEPFSIPITNKIFHIDVLILITIMVNLWHQKFVRAMALQCLSTNNMVFSDKDKILIKRLYLKRYTANRMTDEFNEKSW